MDLALLKEPLVFVDLTTGANFANDRIIEIGIVEAVDAKCVRVNGVRWPIRAWRFRPSSVRLTPASMPRWSRVYRHFPELSVSVPEKL